MLPQLQKVGLSALADFPTFSVIVVRRRWLLEKSQASVASEQSPPAEGTSLESPSEGPAGGALPEAHFYAIWLH